MSNEEVIDEEAKVFWKEKFKKYWYVAIVFGAAIIGAFIGGIVVLFRYIDTSAIGGLGTWDIGDFSMGTGILWILLAFLWELLLVILPFIGFCGVVLVILWMMLPEEDRNEMKRMMKREDTKEMRKYRRKKRQKYSGGGGGFSFITFIAFCIIVAINGNWLEPIGNLTYRYFINAYINAIIWIAIIFVIPLCIIGLIWYLKFKK